MNRKDWISLGIFTLITIIITVIQFQKSGSAINDIYYTPYNNYIIFKTSFFHLLEGENLYAWHVEKHWDLFKYSPTFALFMGLFAFLPDIAGMILWNLLNSLVLFWAIYTLPLSRKKQVYLILAFITIELITSLHNLQSNALMAALMILGFNKLEKEKPALAALMLTASVFIKIFGIIAILTFLFYPRKGKFILWSVIWGILLLFLPVILTGFEGLLFQYQNWLEMLKHDHDTSYGYSVIGWLYTWFGLEINKQVIVIAGLFLLLLPYIKIKDYDQPVFRILSLANILIWVVIFNHKAESPTFIIAICGVAIWFFYQKRTPLHIVLLILAFIFTSLSATDLFPRGIRVEFINAYSLKAVPCIFIWMVLSIELLFRKYKPFPVSGNKDDIIE